MKARLFSVVFGLFLMIASIGQCLHWVTTSSKRQVPWASGLGYLKSQDVARHQRSPALLSRDHKITSQASSIVSNGVSQSISQTKIEKVERPALKFKKVRVMGRMASPRLDFTQESLPVERVDEPMRQEFFQRVFSPVGDYSF